MGPPTWAGGYPSATEAEGFRVAEYDRRIGVYPSLGYDIHVLSKVSVAERADFGLSPPNDPRACPTTKWIVSRSLKSVGPNATLVEDDIEAVIRGLKAQLVGEI